jgi:NitT/TauT family transport system permease protein
MTALTVAVPGSSVSRWGLRVLGAALACGFWQYTGKRGTFGSTWPALSDVLHEAWAKHDLLRRALAASFPTMLKGFALGVALGALLATIPQMVPAIAGVSTRLATVVNALPLVVLAPVLITILGIGRVQVFVAALACFFPMFVATAAGLDGTRRSHLDVMSCLGASRWSQLRRVRLPAALPHVVDGFRLAAPAAVLGAIFGEWFGAEKGLGAVLVSSMQNFQVRLLWAAALLSTLISIAALVGFTALARWAQARFA